MLTVCMHTPCSGTFQVPDVQPRDTFLSLDCATKGLAFVNSCNLGWYWPAAGPQLTLYVPGACLQQGTNWLVVVEFGGMVYGCEGQRPSLPSGSWHASSSACGCSSGRSAQCVATS